MPYDICLDKTEGLTSKHHKANLTNEVHGREKRNLGLGLGGLGGIGGIGGRGSLGTGGLGALGGGLGGLGALGGGIGGLGALGGGFGGLGGLGTGHLQGATALNAAGFGGLGRPTFDFADYYANFLADAAYDYYDWVCTGASCQLCDVLTGDCCDPNYDRNCFLPDSCANNPCLSGGTCISTLTVDFRPDFMCVCTAGLTGKYCQLIDEYSAAVPVAAVGAAPVAAAAAAPAAAPVAPVAQAAQTAQVVSPTQFQTVQTIARPQTATVQVVQTFPQNKNFQIQQSQPVVQFQSVPAQQQQSSFTFLQPTAQQSQPVQATYQTVQTQPVQTFQTTYQSAPQYGQTYSTQTLSAAAPTNQVFKQDGTYLGTLST